MIFLSLIYPSSIMHDSYRVWQEAELNDRKIGKLCDYASKNPLRIPKVNSFSKVFYFLHHL